MGDSYEDIVELGFEGLDKFTTKFHDHVNVNPTHWHRHKAKNGAPPPPPPPQAQDTQSRAKQRARSQSFDRGKKMYDDDARSAYSGPRSVYGGGPRDEEDWKDDVSMYEPESRPRDGGKERGYYASPHRREPLARGPAMYRGYPDDQYMAVAPRGPIAPPGPPLADVIKPPPPPEDIWEDSRRRPAPARRRSSYSPPRHSTRRKESPPRRVRSRSPNHHRVAATLVGALAGGFVGHAAKKGDTIATVAGAVVGGLGAREAEKMYDRRKDKKLEDEWRRERRRREPEWR